MKKNLNIAYLNGAEGMIRKSGASSGGSGSGGSGNEIKWEYYKIDWSYIESEQIGIKFVEEVILMADMINYMYYAGSAEIVKVISPTYMMMLNYETFHPISELDNYGGIILRYIKIAALNSPIRIKGANIIDGEFDDIIDNGSWQKNITQLLDGDAYECDWLVPITEEEFYSFDDVIVPT